MCVCGGGGEDTSPADRLHGPDTVNQGVSRRACHLEALYIKDLRRYGRVSSHDGDLIRGPWLPAAPPRSLAE